MSTRTAECPKCHQQVKRYDCYSGHGSGEGTVLEVFMCDCGKTFTHVWSDFDWTNNTGKPFVVEDKIVWG